MSDEKEIQVHVKGNYPRLTAEQKKEVAKGVDHDALIKGLQVRQGKVIRFVREKYSSDSKPLWIDKGTNTQ